MIYCSYSALQSQNAVSAYPTRKQILLFDIARQYDNSRSVLNGVSRSRLPPTPRLQQSTRPTHKLAETVFPGSILTL